MKVALERWGRNALARAIGTFAPVRKTNALAVCETLRTSPSAKILIIRPQQGHGDLLLATPALRALRMANPSVQIHFLADTYNVLAIKDNPRLHKVWVWDKERLKNPFRLASFMRALRAERFVIAIPLFSHIPSFTSFLIARFCGARFVWAYDTRPFYDGAPWSRSLAHVEIANRSEETPEYEKFMELVCPFVGSPGPDDFTTEFEVRAKNQDWARDEWRNLNLPANSKKVGLFFGGNPDRPERLWPTTYWRELAIQLQKTPGLSLVAVVPPPDLKSGSRALEEGVYAQVAGSLVPQPPVFLNNDLARVAAFLQGLDLFVCVDGGLFHIAVAAKVRTLGLFFKTDPARWKPPVAWATVLRPPDDRPVSLLPEQVYQKICEMVLKSIYV
jgi:ADP-heptose:LPS heptosyltransferase